MPTCCVCKNYSSKTRGKGIGYHRFPQDEVRLQKWLTAVKSHLQPAWTIEKIRAINNTQSPAHVCTEHFSSACCSENMKARFFQGKRPAKVLSEDAVPTIFGERKAGESSTSDLGQTAHRQPIQELLMPTSSTVLQPQPAPGAVVQQPCHTPSPGVQQPRHTPSPGVQQPHHTPSPGVQQPRHTPSPGVQQPRHTPSPGVQQPRHTPSPGVQQPHHTPSPGVQQPHHTPSPGVQQPRHTPSPGVQQPHHTPSPGVQQPHHTPSPGVQQPRHTPSPGVQQPCHTPSPGVQQPRHTPSPGVQQPHHTPSPGVQQPRHTPSPGVQQPRHTPSPGVQQPRHTPSPGVQQPRHTPSPGVQQPRHTPSPGVQQPRHTPSPGVQQPRHTPSPGVQKPRHTPSPDLDALYDYDQPSHTLDEAALPPPNTPGPSCMQDTPLHGWPSCFSTPRSCSSSSLSFHSYCRVPSPTKYRDAATQTDDKLPSGKLPVRSSSPLPSPIKKCKNADLSFTSVSSVSTRVGEKDTTYHPSDDDAGSSASSPRTSKSMQQGEPTANYFIVRYEKIVDLFKNKRCSVSGCGGELMVYETFSTGSALTLKYTCPKSHCGYWHSQPHVGDTTSFEGNLLLPAAIIIAGGTFTKFSDIAQTLSLQCFGETQFKEVQRNVVFPVIDEHYLSEQQGVLSLFCNQGEEEDTTKVTLLGDGRCDSPGYNAKYCSYSFMEEQSQYIVDFQLVQVSETTSSQAMEKMGFLRSLEFLENEGMNIGCIATDRHVGIRAALKQRRDIDHQFDVFHMAKSVKKKLAAHAKTRNKRDLFPWLKAISTHLWWCSSTCGNDAVILCEKWRSVANHVANRHEGFEENHTFTECEHLPLSEEDRTDIKWLKPGSDAHKALYEVVNAPALLRDLEHLTRFKHTGALEVFHSMLLKYADKRHHFPYPSMKARLQLAVLDHNENVHREQATTKHGDRKWDAAWSKRAADWISRRRYQKKTFSFREELMNGVLEKASVGSYRSGQHVLPDPDVGGRNIAPVERPDKAALVEKFLSRFEGH
ncbi:uncharacterized protein LOC144910817 isoform X2 [Branchiostoma floridae x Branchiostoma belcheri]